MFLYSVRWRIRKMIDLHIHILPGIDDGAATSQEALAMARSAVAGGIKAVVATPHVISGLFNNDKSGILAAVHLLQKYLQDCDIPLTVYPGAEYMLEPDLAEGLAAGEILTLADGGRYLLVEFPAVGIPLHADQALFEISLQGVTPIIAHPERNIELLRDPGKLRPFLERGALCQGTAASFSGMFGKKVRQVALTYLLEGYYSFISSDAHGDGARARAPVLTDFLAVAEKSAPAVGELLTVTNPELLLSGQPLLTPPKLTENSSSIKQGLWSKLWRR